ncbi:DUF2867 domain-containing protein [Propionibacteriaceae bacterium Y2011]
MRNVHERVIDAPADVVGALLDDLGGPEDRLWPSPEFWPMVLDRRLQVGADGGHSTIRYRCDVHEPRRRAGFVFLPETGLDGRMDFTVEPLGPSRCRIRLAVDAEPRGLMRLVLPAVVEPLHDAVTEDIFDNAEREATGAVARPARWSPVARALWPVTGDGATAAPIPEEAALLRPWVEGADLLDAWQVEWRPGLPTDPQVWADAAFRSPPGWVTALLLLRNQLVRLVGIPQSDASAFRTHERRDGVAGGEVLLGDDDEHLDFRASVLVSGDRVTLSTAAHTHNLRGRLYLVPVRVAHPVIVRAMLNRAARQLALAARRSRRTGRGRRGVARTG